VSFLNVIVLSVVSQTVTFAKCRFSDCHFASVLMLSVIMLSANTCVVTLIFIKLYAVTLIVIKLYAITVCDITLIVRMINDKTLDVFMESVVDHRSRNTKPEIELHVIIITFKIRIKIIAADGFRQNVHLQKTDLFLLFF
jgi:hypothetical protein